MPGSTKTGAAKKRSAKTGLPPGFLIHIGEKHAENVKITLREYDESYFREKEITTSGRGSAPSRQGGRHLDSY